MIFKSSLFLVVGPVLGSIIQPRQNAGNTATVDLSVQRGAPQHLASGFIYGIPDSGFGQSATQIPDHFYTDIGFNYARGGGAQTASGGWISGQYPVRFDSNKSNYLTARKFGARYQLLNHDIWGTDHASTVWPGDNGNWVDYDNYLNRLISDLKANNMLAGLDFEIWNEPELSFFWARSQAQFFQLYVRTHRRIRQDSALNGVQIVGPSFSSQPNSGNSWWTGWLQTVTSSNTIPDQYTWHDEPGDVQVDVANLANLLKQYGAPTRPVNLNEYATFDEQVPSGAAWWMSRLERANAHGLRGNWLSGCHLHDFMASLLGKTDTNSCTSSAGYYGNGEFQVYKYYNQQMVGVRAQTTGTGDGIMDVYATIASDKVRTLAGVRLKTGTWYITIKGLTSVGLPASGTLNIQTYGFEDKGHFGRLDGSSNRGVFGHAYSGNSVTFPVYQTTEDKNTAWAFEFSR